MDKEKLKVELVLKEKMLGTVPKNQDVYAKYIATKAPLPENGEAEVETVEEIEEKAWTGFHKDDNGYFIYNYMIKGFLKAACEVLQATGELKKIPSYKKWMDLLVFIHPRKLYFGKHEVDGVTERPLRAMTAMGPRVTVTRSDHFNPGTKIITEIEILKNTKGITPEVIMGCLKYGEYVGLGQWRGSGGYGQFAYTVME